MPARARRPTVRPDSGSTLVEVVVVCAILAVLAAIGTLSISERRQRTVDAALRADLRAVSQAVETFYSDQAVYPAAGALAATGASVTIAGSGAPAVLVSEGNTLRYVRTAAGDAFCLYLENASSTLGAGRGFAYVSNRGGEQGAAATGTCTVP
ncbi:type II secretion system protein [Cellulomonas endophytica]|uniref:type II secretion system protein n=1 Tax=Cellulomonas endophytica TaxID=2494735 RepID=UPI001013B7CB|nr:prepilin-type N-terminal cleavage/methylation domain-containing protein [Cellulomonas endophytica]